MFESKTIYMNNAIMIVLLMYIVSLSDYKITHVVDITLASSTMLPCLVLIALLCTGVHGTSNGAPDSVCQNANMFPSGHNSAAATGPSPYSITVDAEQYAAGASLTGKTGYGCQLLKYFSKFA